MDAAPRFAIGLGANLGDRAASLEAALAMLDAHPGVELLASSTIVETPPWGDADQGPFLNAVVVGRTSLAPPTLLDLGQSVERALGKRVIRKWGPRAIDVDLLFVEGVASDTGELRLPHPHMADRPFVFIPLREALAASGMPRELCPAPSAAGVAIAGLAQACGATRAFPLHAHPGDRAAIASASLEDVHELGSRLALLLRSGGFLALDGELGAGKSELARATIRAFGVAGRIPSPTFTLCRQYEAPPLAVEHWDFYRLGDESELDSAGFGGMHAEPRAVLVEWASRFPGALPPGALHVRLDVLDGDRRRVALRRAGGLPLLLRAMPGCEVGP